MRNTTLVIAIITVSFIAAGCSNAQVATSDIQQPNAQATPSNKFTAADVAKLKWIEGTWRGMDGDKPFYERYKLEETALVVEGLNADGSIKGEPTDSSSRTVNLEKARETSARQQAKSQPTIFSLSPRFRVR
jgi:hypothetical protein